nr:MAG TPA: hypothetical protein [Caudoviricetes sp.]
MFLVFRCFAVLNNRWTMKIISFLFVLYYHICNFALVNKKIRL